jgi:hypothetical protein
VLVWGEIWAHRPTARGLTHCAICAVARWMV